MSSYLGILEQHLSVLAVVYQLLVSDAYDYVIAGGFRLPPGYNRRSIDVLIEIPDDYPLSPPGVSSHIYVPSGLRYHGRHLQDVHEAIGPGWGDWAWLCYRWIDWDPHQDDLLGFLEVVRADLTNPETH